MVFHQIHLRRLAERRFQHLVFLGFPLLVQRFHPGGQLFRLGSVPGGEHVKGDPRGGHAAAGVHPWGDLEAHLIAADGSLYTCALHHCPESGPFRVGQLLQPQRRDHPVFIRERHHVRHGGDSRQLHQLHCLLPCQGQRQLPGHPRPAQAGKGIIPQQGRHHRVGGGQRVQMPMVVGHHDRHAQFLGPADLSDAGDAAVHGDKDIRFPGQLFHRGDVQPVAFLVTVGEINHCVHAQVLQRFIQNGGGGYPIHVVVPIDHRPPALRRRVPDDGRRFFQAMQRQGGPQLIGCRMEEALRRLRRCNAPRRQQSAQPGGQPSQREDWDRRLGKGNGDHHDLRTGEESDKKG